MSSNTYEDNVKRGEVLLTKFEPGVTIFGSARSRTGDADFEEARMLGRLLAEGKVSVITGGGPGIMEAANAGAFEAGGVSVGMNIVLPKEQAINKFVTLSTEFDYFSVRKTMMIRAAFAYVFFPGGFGTLDELTEVVELIQTGKIPRRPVFLYDSKFWHEFDTHISLAMLERKFIDFGDEKIYTVTNSVAEICAAVLK